MPSLKRRGLVASMEDLSEELVETLPVNDTQDNIDPQVGEAQPENPEPVDLDYPQEEVVDISEEPEANEAQLVEAANEVEAVEDTIDESSDVMDRVEEVSDIVERANENGGLDPSGAEILKVTLESLYERVGISGGKYVPALEEFGGVSNRIRAGNISVEDMKEKLKAIWEAIVKAIQVGVAKAMEFLKLLFNQIERYKQRIVKLKAIVEKAPDSAKVSGFEDMAIANALAVGNSVPTDLSAPISELQAQGEKLTNSLNAWDSEAGKKILNGINLLSQGTDFNIVAESISDSIIELGTIMDSNQLITQAPDPASGLAHGDWLLGNVRFASNITNLKEMDKVKVKDLLVKMKIKIELEKNEKVQVKAGLKPLTKNEALALLTNTEGLLAQLEAIRGNAEKVQKLKKDLATASATLKNAKISEEQGEVAGAIRGMLIQTPRVLDQVQKLFLRAGMDIVMGSCKYVERSMRARQAQDQASAPRLAAPAAA